MLIHAQRQKVFLNDQSDMSHSQSGRLLKKCVQSKNKITLRKNNIQNKSASVNFQGGFFKLSNEAEKRFLTSKGFNKFAKLTTDPVMLEAVSAIGFASVLRPATILAVPGEKRDKEYAASHAIASGLLRYGFALAVFGPMEEAVSRVAKNAVKKDQPDYLKGNIIKAGGHAKDVFESLGKYGPKLLLNPLESAIIIATLPLVMKAVFPSKKKAAEKAKQVQQNVSNNIATNQDAKPAFKRNFEVKHSKKVNDTFKNFTGNKNIAFSGRFKELHKIGVKAAKDEKVKLSKFKAYVGSYFVPAAEKLVGSEKTQKLLKRLGTKKISDKLKTWLISGTAFLGTVSYVNRTMKSKEIEPERKKTLAVNQGLTWGISTVAGAFLDKTIFNSFKKLGDKYKKYNTAVVKENFVKGKINLDTRRAELGKIAYRAEKGFGGWAPKLIAFTIMYRYLTPVLATPLADYWKNHIAKNPETVKDKFKNQRIHTPQKTLKTKGSQAA